MTTEEHEDPSGSSTADILRQNLSNRQGLIDSSLPTAVFLVAYLIPGSSLTVALIAAVAGGALVAILRLVRKESLQHILGGFVGVAIAAFLANATGRAQDFFLPGLLLNGAYALAFAGSLALRKPLAGLAVGFISGDRDGWREDPQLRAACVKVTWLWVAVFGLRLVVQLPLYLLGAVAALGTAKLVLGFPLFGGAALLTYRWLSGPLADRRERSGLDPQEPGPQQPLPSVDGSAPMKDPAASESGSQGEPLPDADPQSVPGEESGGSSHSAGR